MLSWTAHVFIYNLTAATETRTVGNRERH